MTRLRATLLTLLAMVVGAALLFQAFQQRINQGLFALGLSDEVRAKLEANKADLRQLARLDPAGAADYRQRFEAVQLLLERSLIVEENQRAIVRRYELLLLAELGFGLDLEQCAVTGDTDELIAVSPRSGRAVSAAEAEPYLGKLLPLPRFVAEGGTGDWEDILDGLSLSGHFLMRDVVTDRSSPVGDARVRLVERMWRAAGAN